MEKWIVVQKMSLLSHITDRKSVRSLQSVTMGNIYSRQIRNTLILLSVDNPATRTWLKKTCCFSFPVFLPPDLCGCVWNVVSGLKPIPLPWACLPTHTYTAPRRTHSAPTHTLTPWTQIPAEQNGADSSPLGARGCQQSQSCSQQSGPAASNETPRGKVSTASWAQMATAKLHWNCNLNKK